LVLERRAQELPLVLAQLPLTPALDLPPRKGQESDLQPWLALLPVSPVLNRPDSLGTRLEQRALRQPLIPPPGRNRFRSAEPVSNRAQSRVVSPVR
jgi:hypothetical protein